MAVDIIYYDNLLSIDLYDLVVPFSLTDWIIKFFLLHTYLGLSSLRNRYTTTASLVLSTGSWDISGLLRIYLQTSTTNHHLRNPLPFIWRLPFISFLLRLIPVFGIESCWVPCSPRYRGGVFMFLRTNIIFLPLFPVPSSYFISLWLVIYFCDHKYLVVFHYQIWNHIQLRWNF